MQKLLDKLVNPLTGLIHSVTLQPAMPGDPDIFIAGARLSDVRQYDVSPPTEYGGSAGLTKESTVMSAVGELIERYCAGVYDKDLMHRATFKEMNGRTIPLNHLQFYLDSQYEDESFQFSKPTEDSFFHWVEGRSLLTNTPISLPAQIVYMPYWPEADEPFIYENNTTGMALGGTPEHAQLGGICEFIERDATMGHWFNQLPPRRLILENTETKQLLENLFPADQWHFDLLDATSEIGIPVVIAILESKINRDIRLACSSACHPNIEIAAQKALIEAYQTFKWLSLLRIEEGEPDFASDFSLVTDYKFHTLMYEDEQFHSQLAFLRENLEESYATDFPKYNTGAPEKLIGPVLDKIDRAGLDVIAIDITAPDVKQVGLHAVRIFMPGLISLNSNFRHRSLGQKRLYAFPDLVAGRAPDIENVEIKELNPYPHPFP